MSLEADMSGETLNWYRDLCRRTHLFVEAEKTHPQDYYAFRADTRSGSGWMDILGIAHGLAVGRCSYRMDKPVAMRYAHGSASIGVQVLVSGDLLLGYNGERPVRVSGEAVWLSDRRKLESVFYHAQPETGLVGVSLDIPIALFEELSGEVGGTPEISASLEGGAAFLDKDSAAHRACVQAAHTLLAQNPATWLERLQMESSGLALVNGLFSCLRRGGGHALPGRHRAAVAAAMRIIREEYAHPHTIASLAQRVGLNECYLKKGFRMVTGATIGDCLRSIRMEAARQMIDSGRFSVQEAAVCVGYSNPSHFSAAFLKTY
jgi:AraC-like DNA-binding protein